MFDFAVFGSLFLTLFVIMDPPGITPIFLALTSGRPAKVQRRMAWQAVCVAFGVIAVFGICGQQILDYLHVSVPALMIAGGLLLLLIALDLGRAAGGQRQEDRRDAGRIHDHEEGEEEGAEDGEVEHSEAPCG